MNPSLDQSAAAGYSSGAQQARRITEDWVSRNGYCPNCGSSSLEPFANNRPVADFHCRSCAQEYELKSTKTRFGAEVLDGAYTSMLARIQADNNPNFFLLTYSTATLSVSDFLVIPRYFVVPSVIRKRKPLAPTARRAGWTGCNILLKNIPSAGKISLINDGRAVAKDQVLDDWKRTHFLANQKVSSRGWTIEIMQAVESLPETFCLRDVYRFEQELQRKFPDNHFVRDKIRQQLQVLRDKGIVEFIGRGSYRKPPAQP